jgi:DNA-binding response OmpR family regulator
MRILIADNDKAIRFLASAALRELGHDVKAVDNGCDAWDKWRTDHYQLVILNWTMPGIDGLELCRRIRRQKTPAFTYIILITGRTGKASYMNAMESGVDDFISKPFDKRQLVTRVRVATRILDLHEPLRLANLDLEHRVHERTAELERALSAKSEFLSRASHELRTPMHHILGFAEVLQWKGLTAKQAVGVQQILTSGRHLLSLIDRLLGVSKANLEDSNFLEPTKAGARAKAA